MGVKGTVKSSLPVQEGGKMSLESEKIASLDQTNAQTKTEEVVE